MNSIFNTYLCVYEHICTCSQSQRTVSFIKSIQSDKLSLLWIKAFHRIFLFFLNHFGFSTSLISFLSNTFSHLFHTLPWFLKWSPTVVSSFSSVRLPWSFQNISPWANEMAHWEKMFATKHDYLNLIPWDAILEEEKWVSQSCLLT